jgi:hypothetical protein
MWGMALLSRLSYICSLKEKLHLKGGKIGIEYSERLQESSSFRETFARDKRDKCGGRAWVSMENGEN